MTWPTTVPILVFLGLSVLDLGPMYATVRQTSHAHHRLMLPPRGRGHNNIFAVATERRRDADSEVLCTGEGQGVEGTREVTRSDSVEAR